MMTFVAIIAGGVLGLMVISTFMAIDLRAIRKRGEASSEYPIRPLLSHHRFTQKPMKGGYFVVWEWRDGRWNLESEDLPEGAKSGPSPEYPGERTGERIKTWVSGEKL
jgi:hypothetical protein